MKEYSKTGIWIRKALFLMTVLLLSMSMTAIADTAYTVEGISSGDDISEVLKSYTKTAHENSDGGIATITIPAGTYKTSQFPIWGNTKIVMEGVTLVRADGSKSMLRLGSKDLDWDNYDGGKGRPGYSSDFSNITFIGGVWDGNGDAASIMQMAHAANLVFEGVTFKSVKEAHFLEFAGCKDITIRNCVFTEYKGNFSNSYNGEAIQFEILNKTASGHISGYNPLDDETPCANVEICGCTFSKLKRGLGSHTAILNQYFSNFNIHDNVFTDITGYAIGIMNYVNTKIYNNTISNCGGGILITASKKDNMYPSEKVSNSRSKAKSLNVTINNNTITIEQGANGVKYNNSCFGIRFDGEKLSKASGRMPKGDWRVSGVTVKKNTFKMNVAAPAVWLLGTYKNKITGNKITCTYKKSGNCKSDGAICFRDGESDSIASNTINNTKKTGLGKKMSGIRLQGKNKNLKLQKNTIKNAGLDGIRIDASSKSTKIQIVKNTITGSGRYGIYGHKKKISKDSGNKITGSKTKDRNYKK